MIITPGTTDVRIEILVVDDDGKPVTGLVAATMPDIYYSRVGETLPSALTLSDLAAQNSTHSDGGVKELAVGRYRLDLPDAACATATLLYIFGEETDKRVIHDPIMVADITADAVKIAGSATAATNLKQSALALATGTVEADGSNTATTFKVDSTLGAKAANYFGNGDGGMVLAFVAGTTNEWQSRRVTAFNTTTDFITVEEAFDGTPTASDGFVLLGRITELT